MEENYLATVGNRLKGFGKALLWGAGEPIVSEVVEIAVNAVIKKACYKINETLNELFKKSVINSLITLALNIAGMLIVIFRPFGTVVSNYIGAALFIGACVFFIVRVGLYLRDYGKQALKVTENVWKEKSLSKGIGNYVLKEFPVISLAYTGIDIAKFIVPGLEKVPEIDETVKYFIRTFWKKAALFAGIMLVYTVCVFLILKPFLLKSCVGMEWYEIYLFPFVHVWKMI